MEKQNIIKENRVGRFKVTHNVFKKDYLENESLLEFFGNFIIVRAESMFHGRSIEYMAYSKLFEKIPEDVVAPEYSIAVHKEEAEDGFSYTFTAEKQGD